MDQKCEPLNQDDIADLAAKRTWVCQHYDEAARHKYDTLDGKLVLIDTILRNKWIAPDQTLKLQCLGVTFGDALAQKLGLRCGLPSRTNTVAIRRSLSRARRFSYSRSRRSLNVSSVVKRSRSMGYSKTPAGLSSGSDAKGSNTQGIFMPWKSGRKRRRSSL